MASVGVLWGFGDAAELAGSGATVLCETPEGLPATVTELLKA
jgi:phosphoglycolate phosphatase-like HAD superfamily hydrolase